MIPDVQEQIRQIQLYTKRLMHANIFGHARSKQKGTSLEFDQIREYQSGDDVRAIDWNGSARMNRLLTKQFYDEKQRTIMVALDISASTHYGSSVALKLHTARTVAALLSFAAFLAKDEIGLLLFTNKKEWYIPARKGREHVQEILQKIFSHEPQNGLTDFETVIKDVAALRKKNMMLFLISDFIGLDASCGLSLIAPYDTVAIRIMDHAERSWQVSGLVTVKDPETGALHILKHHQNLNHQLSARVIEQEKRLRAHRIDVCDVNPRLPAIDQLMHFFNARQARR